ncbi:hypothetical protein IFM89_019392 [Coptis chinensis]|uniref:DUF4283 domain-containing protein n=1 Tax=Coptis chinensis TaxID=261450 RepID=A0A835IPA3_9MAGN|nr:hypothetical protein IFM89_019392 [Coptis chinensis]
MVADKDLFYFKFVNEEDRQLVIELGSLFIASRVLVVRPWSESVEQQCSKIRSLSVWVKMDLPKLLWTKKRIEFVGSILGGCMDVATSKRERLSYARACVVVDTDFSFPSSTRVDLGKGVQVDIALDYNWVPKKCQICNTFGHSDAKCPKQQGDTSKGEKNQHLQKKQPKHKQRWTPKKTTNVQGGAGSGGDNVVNLIEMGSLPIFVVDDLQVPIAQTIVNNVTDAQQICVVGVNTVAAPLDEDMATTDWRTTPAKSQPLLSSIGRDKVVSLCNGNTFEVLMSNTNINVNTITGDTDVNSVKGMQGNDIYDINFDMDKGMHLMLYKDMDATPQVELVATSGVKENLSLKSNLLRFSCIVEREGCMRDL